MAIYRMVLEGHAGTVQVRNTLFYRLGVGIDWGGLTMAGSKELTDQWIEQYCEAFLNLMSNSYTLDQITTYAYDSTTFDLIFQQPYTGALGSAGQITSAIRDYATCLIWKFVLEPVAVVGNGPKPPRKGYFAYGPVPGAFLDNTGHISTEIETPTTYNAARSAFEQTLYGDVGTILDPGIFYPIRVHQDKLVGSNLFKITSFADVQGVTLRRLASWRRSRQPEA